MVGTVPLDGGGISSRSLDIEWLEEDLRLWHPRVLATGDFRFELSGLSGIPTIIELPSDLVAWQPLATNAYVANQPGVFTDPAPLIPHRYYRAGQR